MVHVRRKPHFGHQPRRFFNGNVRDMCTLCEMFPTSLLAGMFGFKAPTYFELDDDAERVVPRVEL